MCTPVSSNNQTDCHDITEILKVALNTIIPDPEYPLPEYPLHSRSLVSSLLMKIHEITMGIFID